MTKTSGGASLARAHRLWTHHLMIWSCVIVQPLVSHIGRVSISDSIE